MHVPTTQEAPMTRKPLRALQPGDKLLRIEPRKLQGPRGGKYEFRGMTPRNGTAMEFTHTTLDASGVERTYHFKGAHPLRINSKLSCQLVAQVQA
jgi:hypothetical protein